VTGPRAGQGTGRGLYGVATGDPGWHRAWYRHVSSGSFVAAGCFVPAASRPGAPVKVPGQCPVLDGRRDDSWAMIAGDGRAAGPGSPAAAARTRGSWHQPWPGCGPGLFKGASAGPGGRSWS